MHTFRKTEEDGTVVCCHCGATLTPCWMCQIAGCPVHLNFQEQIDAHNFYMFNCPVMSPNYEVSYGVKHGSR